MVPKSNNFTASQKPEKSQNFNTYILPEDENSEQGMRHNTYKVMTFKAAKPFHSTEFDNQESFKLVDLSESTGNVLADSFQVSISSTFYEQLLRTKVFCAAFLQCQIKALGTF